MQLSELQTLIHAIYGAKDQARGSAATFVWLIEEIGELARSLHRNDPHNLQEEFADCLAWLVTLANLHQINLDHAIKKYTQGCPRCGSIPCQCAEPG